MSEMTRENNLSALRKKTNVNSSLVFQIPEAVLNRLNQIPADGEVVLELEAKEERVVSREAINSEARFEVVQTTQEVEIEFKVEEIVVVKATEEVTKETIEPVVEIAEPIREIIPFYELKLQNPEAVYKVGNSYLADIEQGKKHFGFASFKEEANDSLLLVYASFIQQALKRPVLIVVKNVEGKSFDRHRTQMSDGNLLGWKTKDWGDLCFVDYRQLITTENKFNKMNIEFINNHFAAVLWSIPKGNAHDKFQQVFLTMVGSLNSLALVLEKGITTSKEVNNTVEYYKCFNVPIKGMLFDS